MGISKCEIEFNDNPAKVYYSGQLVGGTIQLTLREKKKVRGVFVQIIGTVYVRFTEMNGQTNTEYIGKEVIFDKRIDLVHDESNNGKIRLDPGSYTYPFEHQLPDNLPSSLEYKCGYIRYKVCFVLDNGLWSNDEFSNTFTVIGSSALTPHMREPITVQSSKTFNVVCFGSCFPTNKEPLRIVAEIPCGGYLPRQSIDLHMNVNNKSSQPVIEFTVILLQKLKYEANNSKKKSDKIVLKQEYVPGCEAGDERKFDVNIIVPTVPPSSQLSSICRIIKIEYFIRILVSVPFCHTDPELWLPITIGSSPIQEEPMLPAWINPLANDFE